MVIYAQGRLVSDKSGDKAWKLVENLLRYSGKLLSKSRRQ